jgi:type IV secretion system protein TrbD
MTERDQVPEGYVIPLRTSLTRPILLGGVPRAFAILNATLAAAIAFGLQQPFIGLPMWVIAQGAAAWAGARDPWFLETWPRHLAKPLYLSA